MKCPNCDEPEMHEHYYADTGFTVYYCDHCHYEETR